MSLQRRVGGFRQPVGTFAVRDWDVGVDISVDLNLS